MVEKEQEPGQLYKEQDGPDGDLVKEDIFQLLHIETLSNLCFFRFEIENDSRNPLVDKDKGHGIGHNHACHEWVTHHDDPCDNPQNTRPKKGAAQLLVHFLYFKTHDRLGNTSKESPESKDEGNEGHFFKEGS